MKEQPAIHEHGNLVVEAVNALARMDAGRLEELVRTCRALDPADAAKDRSGHRGLEVQKLRREMAVLARVLEATRSNAGVLRRLRAFGSPEIEYKCKPEDGWFVARSGNGHDSIGV